MKKKLVKLYYLNVGDKFEYPELNSFRDLTVVRTSESGTGISGQVTDDNGETWKNLSANYTVSNGSLVIPL